VCIVHQQAEFVFVFQGGDFGIVEATVGYAGAIRMGKVALLPYGSVGGGISWHEDDYDASGLGDGNNPSAMAIGFSVQAGLMFTTSYVSGLFLKTAYQYNHYDGLWGRTLALKDTAHSLIIGVGYLFK
jgi:hypothetical protein